MIDKIICAILGFGLGFYAGIFMIAALVASGKEDDNGEEY